VYRPCPPGRALATSTVVEAGRADTLLQVSHRCHIYIMFTTVIARWVLGHFSKETVGWILGGFLLVPMAVVPLVVVAVLFVGLRKVTPIRKVGIINLIVASGVTLLIFPALIILPGAVLHPAVSFWLVWSATASLTICWLVGAIGLFSRRRLAWCGSVLGTGALTCLLVAVISTGMAVITYPAEDVFSSAPLLFGYVCSRIFVFAWLCLALTVSLWLLFGLLRIRADNFGRGTSLPNKPD